MLELLPCLPVSHLQEPRKNQPAGRTRRSSEVPVWVVSRISAGALTGGSNAGGSDGRARSFYCASTIGESFLADVGHMVVDMKWFCRMYSTSRTSTAVAFARPAAACLVSIRGDTCSIYSPQIISDRSKSVTESVECDAVYERISKNAGSMNHSVPVLQPIAVIQPFVNSVVRLQALSKVSARGGESDTIQFST